MISGLKYWLVPNITIFFVIWNDKLRTPLSYLKLPNWIQIQTNLLKMDPTLNLLSRTPMNLLKQYIKFIDPLVKPIGGHFWKFFTCKFGLKQKYLPLDKIRVWLCNTNRIFCLMSFFFVCASWFTFFLSGLIFFSVRGSTKLDLVTCIHPLHHLLATTL